MSHDELDRILSGEPEIVPSSGFTANVMDTVRREATEPPPIPFPWRRVLPGLAVSVVALGMLVAMGLSEMRQMPANKISIPIEWVAVARQLAAPEAGWGALALLLCICSWTLVRHFPGWRS